MFAVLRPLSNFGFSTMESGGSGAVFFEGTSVISEHPESRSDNISLVTGRIKMKHKTFVFCLYEMVHQQYIKDRE
jgi:hypothetical protein